MVDPLAHGLELPVASVVAAGVGPLTGVAALMRGQVVLVVEGLGAELALVLLGILMGDLVLLQRLLCRVNFTTYFAVEFLLSVSVLHVALQVCFVEETFPTDLANLVPGPVLVHFLVHCQLPSVNKSDVQ